MDSHTWGKIARCAYIIQWNANFMQILSPLDFP